MLIRMSPEGSVSADLRLNRIAVEQSASCVTTSSGFHLQQATLIQSTFATPG